MAIYNGQPYTPMHAGYNNGYPVDQHGYLYTSPAQTSQPTTAASVPASAPYQPVSYSYTTTGEPSSSTTAAALPATYPAAAVNTEPAPAIQIPTIYDEKNLAFITKAKDREPSLYFISGAAGARIRQQHENGGKTATYDTYQVDHFFFGNKDNMKEFKKAVQKASRKALEGKKDDSSAPPDPADYGGLHYIDSEGRFVGAYHFEAVYRAYRVLKNTHVSAGKVQAPGEYKNNDKIRAAYIAAYTAADESE